MDKPLILIVDDEQLIRQTIRKSLGTDYQFLEATNGSTAVELAIQHKPNLILLDILMPVMDGYQACVVLKGNEITKRIPLLMLTALDMELNRKLASNFGADGYITKPFDIKSFKATIIQFLK